MICGSLFVLNSCWNAAVCPVCLKEYALVIETGRVSLLPNLRSISLCLPVRCLSCQAVSDTYEAFLDIPLDIQVRCFEIVVQNVSRPLQGA